MSEPLWRLMFMAYESAPCTDEEGYAAEIEAIRDWLLALESDNTDPYEVSEEEIIRRSERQRLRAQLTNQARIAREGE